MSAETPAPGSSEHLDLSVFAPYLVKTRWFGGKGRDFEVTGSRRIGRLGDGDPTLDVLLVELTYADDGAHELYQVPLSYYTEPQHRLDHAFVGWWEDPDLGWVHAYDALHDKQATGLWLRAFGAAASGTAEVGGLTFHRVPGEDVDLTAAGSLFSGEQSNSSVLYGDDSVLKIFRKVTPGPNPDITTHDALTRAGSTHVAHLYGWVELVPEADAGGGGLPTHLGMLQQFLRTATDGWDLALTSVRDLYADPEVEAREAGGDFSGEAGRLGEALREVHTTLHEQVPTDPASAPTPAAIATAMRTRLEAALPVVPGLAPHADRLRAAYDALGALPRIDVQTVHGDLHLGQTLRTAAGWKIVDFEGEPAKTLAERLLPDSPWRDVAGMLRSFDYAPHAGERQRQESGDDEATDERRRRGQEWSARNQRYFLAAYAGGDLTAEQQVLVDAYVADKAVYETVYETRNRPAWVEIPLAAVARIGAR
ncbi:hypothetical protein [Nocardioides sp. 1609]|uniref:maltokinase N-terminal cap-like domain-containing protein n=1 Tax=Nocardioides sp. 1609 TaxID=2508327 RepID=UPI00107054A6|nr:hypothetical protein [Nocardioides sp. 1609]